MNTNKNEVKEMRKVKEKKTKKSKTRTDNIKSMEHSIKEGEETEVQKGNEKSHKGTDRGYK